MKNKKGQILQNFGGLAIGIATFCIVLVVAFLVMAQVKVQDESVTGTLCDEENGSAGCNATKELQSATGQLPGWMPLIVIVIIGGTILAMVSRFGKD